MKYFVSCILVLLACPAYAGTVRIGLFGAEAGTAADWVVAEGTYSVTAAGHRKASLEAGHTVRLEMKGALVRLSVNREVVGNFSRIKFISLPADGTMRIRPGEGNTWYTYGGHFEIQVSQGRLRIVNNIDLEGYVAAVVESEAGANSSLEYLKVQSVLCRTYGLSHTDRHAAEGFQLCDRVHCQVYKGKSRFNPKAKEAVEATRNRVLVDTGNRLILAAYHSNCGGCTLPADSVWSRHAGYLLPVQDTFCIQGLHAAWTTALARKSWLEYLSEKTGLAVPDALADSSLVYQPAGRSATYFFQGKPLPLKKIREDWKLNSTWFSIAIEGDTVLFTGRGFGHGVGLCQEGAMQMALTGKNFADIIGFYFSGVRFADADALKLLH